HELVVGVLGGDGEVVALVQVLLFQEGEDKDGPGGAALRVAAGAVGDAAGGEGAVRLVVVVQRHADLLEVVFAAGAVVGLAHLLAGGQQEGEEDGDDGDDDQELDQGERERAAGGTTGQHREPPSAWRAGRERRSPARGRSPP